MRSCRHRLRGTGADDCERERVSRRTFLMNVGIALNAIVGVAIATPVVVYLLGPVLRRKEYRALDFAWRCDGVSAGRDEAGDVSQSVPRSVGWRDGQCAGVCAVHGSGQVHGVCDQLRASRMSGALVFGVATVYVSVPRRRVLRGWQRASGPPERGLFTYETKIEDGKLMINAGQMPTLANRASARPCPATWAPVRTDRTARQVANEPGAEDCSMPWYKAHLRLVRAAAAARRADQGRRAASGAEEHGELVVRLRQREPDAADSAGRDGHSAGAGVCAFGGARVEDAAGSEPSTAAGMVSARDARMGIELHGRRRADPHGAGVSLRRVQVSARADVDSRRLPAADDAGHGVHRAGAALRSGCVLGARHRGVDHEPRAVDRRRSWCT